MIPLKARGSHALRFTLNFSPDFYSPYPLHLVDFMPLLRLYGDLKPRQLFPARRRSRGPADRQAGEVADVVIDPVSLLKPSRTPRKHHVVAWECCSKRGSSTAPRSDDNRGQRAYAEELVVLIR